MAVVKVDDCHQSYFSWVDPEKYEEGGATAKKMIEILEDRFRETINNQEIALKYNCVELIGDKGSLAYANFFIGNLTEAKAALAEARDFIQISSKRKLCGEEYLTGFDYVFDSLELYMDTKDQENLDPGLWKKLPSFEGFSGKSKAGALALKFYFYRQLRTCFEHQLEVSSEMISLDPEHFEWHLCRASILQYMRRQVRYDPDQPVNPASFAEEILEIELAKSLAPDNPVCALEYCQILAEIMKRSKRMYQDWQSPLKCGTLTFSSAQDTVAYLKRESSKILERYNQSVRVNLTLADIFFRWIPRKHRDLTLAKDCLLKALELHPKSSKANHRLANFYMGFDTSDMSEAKKFCVLAVEYDSRNFPAVADLIQILLGDIEKNKDQLGDLLDSQLNESSAPFEKRKIDLLFFKGLFLHLRFDYENEATEAWLNAQEIANGDLPFDTLFHIHERYKWPLGHLAISKICQTVQYSRTDLSYSQGKEEVIQKLLASLNKAEQKEQAQRAAFEALRNIGESGSGGPSRRGGNNRGGLFGPSRGLRGEYRRHWGTSQNGGCRGHCQGYRGRSSDRGDRGGHSDTENSSSGNWR